MVQSKILNGEYDSPQNFAADFDLLFSNAKTFNEPGSEIYEDAQTLQVCTCLAVP